MRAVARVPIIDPGGEVSVGKCGEVWGMVLNEAVDDDGEEVRRKVGMIAIGLGNDIDERGEVGRENSVRCRTLSVRRELSWLLGHLA